MHMHRGTPFPERWHLKQPDQLRRRAVTARSPRAPSFLGNGAVLLRCSALRLQKCIVRGQATLEASSCGKLTFSGTLGHSRRSDDAQPIR